MTILERKNKIWQKTEIGQILLEKYLKAQEKYSKYYNMLEINDEKERQLIELTRNTACYGGSF